MGRGRNSAHPAAQGSFDAVFGGGRSGRGARRQTPRTDDELLGLALGLPADDREFAHVRHRFSGPAFSYDPDRLRVLRTAEGDYESDGTTLLCAGIGDGLSQHAGQPRFVVFNVSPGEVDDDVWMYGNYGSLDEAVEAFHDDAAQRGIDSGEVTAAALRAELNERFEDQDIPAAPTPPEDPEELRDFIELIDPTRDEFTDLYASGSAFAYNPDTFRTLAVQDMPIGDGEELRAYLVAGQADGLGDRAGAHAFISFYVQYDHDEERSDMLDPTEATSLDEAAKQFAELFETGLATEPAAMSDLNAQLDDARQKLSLKRAQVR